MSNLLKAEWHRIRHSGTMLIMLIFAEIVFVLFSFSSGKLDFSFHTFIEAGSFAIVFALIGITIIITDSYNTRMAFYEVMNGASAHKIVLSKFILSLIMVICLYFLPVCVILFICDGEMMTFEIVLHLFMCIAKLTVFFVSVCMILETSSAVIIPTLLYIWETLPLVMLASEFEIDTSSLMPWFTNSQFTLIGYKALSPDLFAFPVPTEHLMLKISVTFVVEITLMYILAYMSLKKKWNINPRLS